MTRRPEPRRRRPRAVVALTLTGVLVSAACGGDADDPSALDGLPPEDLALVGIEADWQCDVTRFAFDDLAELDALRTSRLAELGIDQETYDEFVERLSEVPRLRDAVQERYAAICVNGPGSTDPDPEDGWVG